MSTRASTRTSLAVLRDLTHRRLHAAWPSEGGANSKSCCRFTEVDSIYSSYPGTGYVATGSYPGTQVLEAPLRPRPVTKYG